jgi:hypothetical protein
VGAGATQLAARQTMSHDDLSFFTTKAACAARNNKT